VHPVDLGFYGHSTVLVSMDGVRILTDPVLRGIFPLRRHGPATDADAVACDVVVISHGHRDHLDLPSLNALPSSPLIVVPLGLAGVLRAAGLHNVREVDAGDRVDVGDGVKIRAFPALHDGNRPPLGPRARALGFVFEGSSVVYFAGDTDIFPEMSSLTGTLDLALLPVWGWGPRLGPGHMDPEGAAEAAELLGARVTIPIHWGSLFPHGFHYVWRDRLTMPPVEFLRFCRKRGVATDVRLLAPGDTTTIHPLVRA
jgi:L-ascorbate metabolism protein UlaG (beta-lactamase superfamily)